MLYSPPPGITEFQQKDYLKRKKGGHQRPKSVFPKLEKPETLKNIGAGFKRSTAKKIYHYQIENNPKSSTTTKCSRLQQFCAKSHPHL
jgi:hypothetical protein